MLSKLTRILLAICTAFVFTGQMEAAAQHCARLALAAAEEITSVFDTRGWRDKVGAGR